MPGLRGASWALGAVRDAAYLAPLVLVVSALSVSALVPLSETNSDKLHSPANVTSVVGANVRSVIGPNENAASGANETFAVGANQTSVPSSVSDSGGVKRQGTTACTRPAIEQFPRSLFDQRQRKAGAVLFYAVGAIYSFLALAAVCDDYFVPSLEVTAHALGLSEDVAGATLLAAGSSAPELATTILAVFVTKDDIGISGVIGSAVFNALLVISLVALLTSGQVCIKAYPMVRDCVCYLFSIVALIVVIFDERIMWYEALLLVLGYMLYCFLMWRNRDVEGWFLSNITCLQDSNKSTYLLNPQDADEEDSDLIENYDTVRDVDLVPFDEAGVFDFPDSHLSRVLCLISLPVIILHYLTIPDVRKERWRNFYWLTFFMSIVWIGLYSYFMVWMITIIGYTLHIPDTVMGLSFVAIGVSTPDVLASVAVARDGYGDMAVSNALGSNVFDILFCMGVPWLIKTAVVSPGSSVKVDSGGVVYSTVLLLATVIFLLASTYLSSWTLTRRYGIYLLLWYVVFLAVSCMIELNLFAVVNLPMCPSVF